MSFQTRMCCQCLRSYEYYQKLNIVDDCPYCGAKGGYAAPLTSAEYMKAMGCKEQSPPKDNP